MSMVVNIETPQASQLALLCDKRGWSAEEAVREAVERLLAQELRSKSHHPAFGSWSDFAEDGVEFQRRLRAEWDSDAGH